MSDNLHVFYLAYKEGFTVLISDLHAMRHLLSVCLSGCPGRLGVSRQPKDGPNLTWEQQYSGLRCGEAFLQVTLPETPYTTDRVQWRGTSLRIRRLYSSKRTPASKNTIYF